MSASQADFPVLVMARVLGVPKAGFYAWRQRPPSARADAALLALVGTIHANSRETCGSPRASTPSCAIAGSATAASASRVPCARPGSSAPAIAEVGP